MSRLALQAIRDREAEHEPHTILVAYAIKIVTCADADNAGSLHSQHPPLEGDVEVVETAPSIVVERHKLERHTP